MKRQRTAAQSQHQSTSSREELPDIDDSYLIFADDTLDLAEFSRQVYGSDERSILEHIVRLNPHLTRSFHKLQPGMPVALSPWSYVHEDESDVAKAVGELASSYGELDENARRTFAEYHDKLTEFMLVMAASETNAIMAESPQGQPYELQLNHILAGTGSVVAGASVKADRIQKKLIEFADYSKQIARQTEGLKGKALYSHPAHKEWRAHYRTFVKEMTPLVSGLGTPALLKDLQPKAIGRFLNIDKRQLYKAKGFAAHLDGIQLTHLYKKAIEINRVLKYGGWIATGAGLYGNAVDIARHCEWGNVISEACGRAVVRNSVSMTSNAGLGTS